MTPSSAPLVDVIIAIHDPARPLQRAIDSLRAQRLDDGVLTITVVCHNLAAAEVRGILEPEVIESVRLLELRDGIRSAAGPFNYGIAQSQARYVAVMGSDDYLEPGAISSWLERAERDELSAVIAPQRHASGHPIRTPPVRPWRAGLLDGVRDRLAYRTAPLGLLRREVVDRLDLQFAPRLSTGEDQSFSAGLWFSGEPIAYAHHSPRYVVGDDAPSRVTLQDRPMEDELRFVRELVDDPWFVESALAVRRSLAVKMTRVHLFSAATRRVERGSWSEADRRFLARLLDDMRTSAPGFERPLSIADRRMIDAIVAVDAAGDILQRSRARRRFGRPATLITRDPRGQFAVEGPIRFMAASALLRSGAPAVRP